MNKYRWCCRFKLYNFIWSINIDGAGGVNIAGNAAEVDITTTGAVDINSAAFTVEATEASSVTTSGGDLTITADANNSKVVIKGDHESGTAIRGVTLTQAQL